MAHVIDGIVELTKPVLVGGLLVGRRDGLVGGGVGRGLVGGRPDRVAWLWWWW